MIVLVDLFAGNVCSRDILVELEKGEKIIDIDDDHVDPQLCASFACDIYKHLRASEVNLHFPWFTHSVFYANGIDFEFNNCSETLYISISGISGKEKTIHKLHGENSEGYKSQHACYID